MSKVTADLVRCPKCSAEWPFGRFESFNADSLGDQVDDILSGQFERIQCTCGHSFQPEHPMLFTSFERKLWIVMHPPVERRYFSEIEAEVEGILREAFDSATPAVQRGLDGIRPQLVFGHRMLAEALRFSLLELDPAVVELAKLLWFRSSVQVLMAHPPFELVFQGKTADGALRCHLHDVVTGGLLGEAQLAPELMTQAMSMPVELRDEYAELFTQPYISVSRFLLDDTI